MRKKSKDYTWQEDLFYSEFICLYLSVMIVLAIAFILLDFDFFLRAIFPALRIGTVIGLGLFGYIQWTKSDSWR